MLTAQWVAAVINSVCGVTRLLAGIVFPNPRCGSWGQTQTIRLLSQVAGSGSSTETQTSELRREARASHKLVCPHRTIESEGV